MDTGILFIVLAICVVIVVPVYFIVRVNIKKTKQKGVTINEDGGNAINGDNNTTISVGSINFPPSSHVGESEDEVLADVDRIKSDLKVIFVDDKRFNVVDLLRKNGWKQVSYKRDISDIDSVEVREAHVFFLDINGVGVVMGFQNQGMGLCGALKRKYGDKKRVVLYSGETQGDIFDSDAKMADDTLKKDSDLYQFTALMEKYGKELL